MSAEMGAQTANASADTGLELPFLEILQSMQSWLSEINDGCNQQDIVRELGLLDMLMWAFLGPWLHLSASVHHAGSIDEQFKQLTNEELSPQMLCLQQHLCEVIKLAISGNRKSQSYFAQATYSKAWHSPKAKVLLSMLHVANSKTLLEFVTGNESNTWMEALANQLQWRAGAGSIFVSLVHDNFAVIRDHINETLLNKVLWWMRVKGPFAQWLQILAVVCVCKNQRVPQQQELVLRMLLSVPSFEGLVKEKFKGNRDKLFLETRFDSTTVRYYAPTTDKSAFNELIHSQRGNWQSVLSAGALKEEISQLTSFRSRQVRATIAVPLSHTAKYVESGISAAWVDQGVHYFNLKTSEALLPFQNDVREGIAHLIPSKFRYTMIRDAILGCNLTAFLYFLVAVTSIWQIRTWRCWARRCT
jgi:hypothetical protein